MKIIHYAACALVFATFSASALDVKQRFNHLDADNSGYLTQAELEPQPQLLSTFMVWDKNQDKRISLSEFKNYLTNNLY